MSDQSKEFQRAMKELRGVSDSYAKMLSGAVREDIFGEEDAIKYAREFLAEHHRRGADSAVEGPQRARRWIGAREGHNQSKRGRLQGRGVLYPGLDLLAKAFLGRRRLRDYQTSVGDIRYDIANAENRRWARWYLVRGRMSLLKCLLFVPISNGLEWFFSLPFPSGRNDEDE